MEKIAFDVISFDVDEYYNSMLLKGTKYFENCVFHNALYK